MDMLCYLITPILFLMNNKLFLLLLHYFCIVLFFSSRCLMYERRLMSGKIASIQLLCLGGFMIDMTMHSDALP